MRNNYILIIGLLVFALGQGHAQRNLSATEAVFIALKNNYQIQISTKQQEIAEKNNTWSEAGLYPTVSLSVGQGNTIQDNTKNPFTFTPGIILSQNIAPSLSANWNIFSGFAVKISKQRLEQLELQSANNAFVVIESTIQDVLKAYFIAQLQSERKELFARVMELSRKRLLYLEVKDKYAATSSLEVLQFKNQYYTDSINYLIQKISYDNAINNLKLYMNEQDSVASTDIFILTDKMDINYSEVDSEKLKNELFESNLNLKIQYINLELQKTNTAFQRSFLYPIVSFQAGINQSYNYLQDLKDDNLNINTQMLSYYGNLNLRYTLFNNWKTKRAVEVSKIQEEIASLNIENLKANLSASLDNLVGLYEVRKQMVELSGQNLIYAQKAFELAELRFETGRINSIDLAGFQNNYQNTMLQHYENLFNKMDSYLEIYKMTGKLGLEYNKE